MMYLVGKIVSTFGIKGELKVLNHSSFDRYTKGNILILKKDNKTIEVTVTSKRVHKNMILLRINDLNNINEVLQYVGYSIYTNHNREELKEGQFYYDDLIGLNVRTLENKEVGIVKDILEVPQGIILEVQGKDKMIRIPFVDNFIKAINDKEIIIKEIEGLL